eukprot:906208-Alexandrium_andersonii.AAC.1
MSASLVGSEMCIRDSHQPPRATLTQDTMPDNDNKNKSKSKSNNKNKNCLLYTSDAARRYA